MRFNCWQLQIFLIPSTLTTMPPQLPVELLSSFVNYLAVAGRGPWSGLSKDLKCCCLAAKVFVSLCQPHIFHSVYLHSGRTIVKASHA